MNDLQLATTLVAPTGTGLLYTAFEQGSDIAAYINGSGATRSRIALKRVQAKPTSNFPGVERMELKRTVYITVGDVEYAIPLTLTSSIPAVIGLSDRTSVFLHGALLARDPIWKTALETGAVPT